MLFIFLLLTGRGVLGRGLSVEPASFTTHGYTSQQQPSVTLYPNSVVVNLHDGNTSSLYNSQTLWLVQFYSHWCGHCQRFAPFWQALAEDIKGWQPHVRVAAINCAEQSCDRYQIRGTPTIRVFHPMTVPNHLDSSYYGFEVPLKHDMEYFKATLLFNLQKVSEMGFSTVSINPIRLVPEPTTEALANMFSNLPDTAEFLALVFEPEFMNSAGKEVLMDMAEQRHLLPVYRVDTSMPGAMAWGLAGTTRPVMVIVDRNGAQVQRVEGWGTVSQDRKRFRAILSSYLNGDNGATQTPVPSIGTSGTTVHVTPVEDSELVDIGSEKDRVFLGDLEKSVEYSLTREVAMQPVLNQQKLKALVYYIEVLLNYLPVIREPIRKFLVSLRDWPVQMGYSSLPHSLYKRKVEELVELHQPFSRTPAGWEGCRGSSPQYRGYPCGLWTLFHTLTVSAATKDPAFPYGGVSSVANSMIGYVSQYFSCRECAHHFASHVSSLGFLPTSPDQSILWLWTIHNIANRNLAGDATEDPAHPKIQWPSDSQCPTCRRSRDRWTPLTMINGQLWNQAEVLKYMKTVFQEESLIDNLPKEEESSQDGKMDVRTVLESLTGRTNWTEAGVLEAKAKIEQYCLQP